MRPVLKMPCNSQNRQSAVLAPQGKQSGRGGGRGGGGGQRYQGDDYAATKRAAVRKLLTGNGLTCCWCTEKSSVLP